MPVNVRPETAADVGLGEDAVSPKKLSVPKAVKIHMMPRPKPRSPMRLTMNAFLAALVGRSALEAVADQQIRAEADRFPEDEQQQVVVGQDQHQHREDEERQVREEAVVTRVPLPCSRSNRQWTRKPTLVTTSSMIAVS